MLTQGPSPYRKCKLIIALFLMLPDLWDCLICTRIVISIVLLLQMMVGQDRWGWLRVSVREQRVGMILQFLFFNGFLDFFLSQIVSAFIQVARTRWLLCLFVCSFFSLHLVPFRWLVGLKGIQPEQQIMELLIILAKKLKPVLFQGYKSA